MTYMIMADDGVVDVWNKFFEDFPHIYHPITFASALERVKFCVFQTLPVIQAFGVADFANERPL